MQLYSDKHALPYDLEHRQQILGGWPSLSAPLNWSTHLSTTLGPETFVPSSFENCNILQTCVILWFRFCDLFDWILIQIHSFFWFVMGRGRRDVIFYFFLLLVALICSFIKIGSEAWDQKFLHCFCCWSQHIA